MTRDPKLAGTLLGTAVGDALGLAAEGMSAKRIARRWGRVDRYHLLGRTGYVSDDTEQAALVAQSLARHPDDAERCAAAFRRSLVGWFWRLPWSIGLGTVRACLKATLGMRHSGVRSAGNGASMRAAVVGAYFRDDAEKRRAFGEAIARVTHTDDRAVEGALYVAEVAAACARGATPAAATEESLEVVTHPQLREALKRAAEKPRETTGFVVHTVAFARWCFVRHGDDPLQALSETVAAGGDTDTIGAIVGAWLGARHGDGGLPAELVANLNEGPFGRSHLGALADCLAALRDGSTPPVPRFSPARAMLRNFAFWPVILAHALRRILP